MTISEWLVNSMVKLQQAGVPNGRTDCLVLLADLLGKDKSWVHTHPEHELDDLSLRELEHKLSRRIGRTPLAYIRGFKEFYGRKFTVNSNVLVPRPESESFIGLLKSLEFEAPLIADIGTGSGCLGITTALELPEAKADLYDIDPRALAVAEHNALQYGLQLHYFESDLLVGLSPAKYDIFLVNLPYVPDGMVTGPEIEKEPAIALFSGKNGLSHYHRFWKQAASLKHKPKYILAESLKDHHVKQQELALAADYAEGDCDGLVQLFEC